MLLTLEVQPGRGLAYFSLGTSLFDAVNLIRKMRNDLSCVEVKYANQVLFHQDIVINFPEHGFHLRFEPRSQRLRLIEVYDVTRLQVKYAKSLIGGASHPATFVRVYDICGATYPGEYDAKTRTYTLHYPGLAFLFPIPAQHAEACSENHIGMPLEFSDGSTPLAGRICIYAASEAWVLENAASSDAVAAAAPPPALAGSLCSEVVEARVHEGLHFRSSGQTISFGDSPQDVWSELGAPSSTAAKSADSMLMHMRSGNPPGADYFYTYHNRGLDILFDGRMHKVRKFVLRTNVPGHPDFNVYAKCNFVLLFPSASAGSGPSLEPLGSSNWDSTSGTDLTVSSREPSGSCSAGSSSLFGLSNPVSPPYASEHPPQEFARDSDGQLKGSQDSFWNSLSTLGNDLFYSPNPSPAAQTSSAEPNSQVGSHQQMQVQAHLDEGPLSSGASVATAVKADEASCGDSALKGEEDGGRELTDARDGWDFDCNFSITDAPGSAPASAAPQGNQGWVGFGPSPDASSAGHTAPGMKAGLPAHADGMPPHHISSTGLKDQQIVKAKGQSHASSSIAGEPSSAEEQGPSKPSITADSTWAEISAVLGDAGRATIHSRGFASNPFGPTLVYGYRGVAFEALKNGHLAGLTLFQAP